MPRVRHENSIDNVPLHMSARGDPGSPSEGRTRKTERDVVETRRGGEREREREGKRFADDAITAPWDAYPGDLCASCAASPFVPPHLLSRSSTSWPPLSKTTLPPPTENSSPEIAVEKTRRVAAYVAMHLCSTSCYCDPNFLGCNKA